MKITPTMPGNRPTTTTAGSSQPRKTTATTTTTLSADDITQAGLQSAQQTLNRPARERYRQQQSGASAGDAGVRQPASGH